MNLQSLRETFERYLEDQVKQHFPGGNPLNDSVLYSLLAPGKRVRPLLCLGFAEGFSGEEKFALASGAAVEMIHAYSLIHDDLPAMDDDDFRRGRPTNHKVFGEATAILAGDALLTFAPQFLLQTLVELRVSPELNLELCQRLLRASGHQGMVKGQALDMRYEAEDTSKLTPENGFEILKKIHRLKTGAIITWSCIAGLYSTQDQKLIQRHTVAVERIGQKIGLLFQVVDDVLDVTASLAEMGKTPGKDQRTGKLTYTNLHGLEKARRLGQDLISETRTELDQLLGTRAELILESVDSLERKLKGTAIS